MAVMAGAGVVVAEPRRMLIDRIGPRITMVGVLVFTALGQCVVAFADTLPGTTLGIALIGVGFGMGWPTSPSPR